LARERSSQTAQTYNGAMKPHPRIRKTVKWGGAAMTLLLVVLWAASLQVVYTWTCRPTDYIQVATGVVRILHSAKGREGVGFEALRAPGLRMPMWSFGWSRNSDRWVLRMPLWPAIGAALAATVIAWRLDTLARRRARLNVCAKCNYDRMGLAAGAVCPECGSKRGPQHTTNNIQHA